jgi:hypothetical protein
MTSEENFEGFSSSVFYMPSSSGSLVTPLKRTLIKRFFRRLLYCATVKKRLNEDGVCFQDLLLYIIYGP